MNNIWLVTTSYGIYSDSHTIRLSNMLGKLDREKFRLTLITLGPRFEHDIGDQIPRLDGVEFTNVPWAMRLIKCLASVPLAGRRLAWVANNVAYRVLIPDQFSGWHKLAERYSRELPEQPDVVISASGSPEAHLAACRIARQSKAKWIADFGDPWHFIDKVNRPKLSKRIEKLERQTVRVADALIFTTRNTLQIYREWLGEDAPAHMAVVPYGFDRDEIKAYPVRQHASPSIQFAHVGTAHTNDRNLIPFIRALADVQRSAEVQATGFLLAGRRSPAFDQEVAQQNIANAELHGKVAYQESLRLQAESDVLIIIGNFNGSQIPGKIFICLALELPILYVSQANPESDEALALLKSNQGVVIARNDERELGLAISHIVSNIQALKAGARERANSKLVQEFESRSLAATVERVISRLAEQ
jgi:hypothetical protein